MTRLTIFVFALFMCGAMSVLNAQDSMGNSDTVWVNSQLGELVKVQFCNNDQNVIVGTKSGIHLLNAADGSIIWSNLVSGVINLTSNRSKTTFYTSHADYKIRKWSLESNTILDEIDYNSFLNPNAILPKAFINRINLNYNEDKLVAVYFPAGNIDVEENQSNTIEINLENHNYTELQTNVKGWEVYEMNVLRDKFAFTYGSAISSTIIKIKEYPTFKELGTLISQNTGAVMDMEFSADGKYIACGTDKGYVIVWDLETKKEILKIKPEGAEDIFKIKYFPNSKYLLVSQAGFFGVDNDRNCKIYNVETKELKSKFFTPATKGIDISTNAQNAILARGEVINLNLERIMDVPNENPTEIIYPNPSNGNVLIEYQSKKTENCEIKIVNERGITIQILHNGLLLEGVHRFEWNSIPFPNGFYFCTITSPSSQKSFKIMINK